jgi:lipoate-protein ligase A
MDGCLVISGPESPWFNMAADETLLQLAHDHGRLVLRLYRWDRPAVSFGYFQSYDAIANLTPVRPLVRRLTGGGLVSHVADWTYSLALPAEHRWYQLKARESYQWVHQWVDRSLQSLGLATSLAARPMSDGPGQCFLGAEQDDVLLRGAKVAGAAQRRTRSGLLIQGSIQIPGSMIQTHRQAWEVAMRSSAPDIVWSELKLDGALREAIERLATSKYAAEAFLKRR